MPGVTIAKENTEPLATITGILENFKATDNTHETSVIPELPELAGAPVDKVSGGVANT